MQRSLKSPGVNKTTTLAPAQRDDISVASRASAESMPSETTEKDNLSKDVRSNGDDSNNGIKQKYGFDVTDLEDPQTQTELVARLEIVSNLAAERLHREYESLGYVADDLMARGDLRKKVQKAHIWKYMSPLALQKECAKQGLEINDDQPKDDLLQLLRESTWEFFDIPVSRLPSPEAARKVLEQVRRCEDKPTSALEQRCKELKIPPGSAKERATPKQLLAQLRQYFIWRHMPLKELQRDCQARSLSLTVDTRLSEDEAQKELFDRLVASLESVTPQMRGIPADRLGAPEVAQEVLAKVDRLQNMGTLSLRLECHRMNVTYRPCMQDQAVVDRLRDVLVWRHLPSEEFQQEAEKQGVFDLTGGDDRNEMINDVLRVRDNEAELDELGLPAKYLEDHDVVMSIWEQFKDVEIMSTERLVNWYENIPFPSSQCIPRKDLEDIAKRVIVWGLLDFEDLKERCSKAGLTVAGITTSDDEKQQLRRSLVRCLGLHQCIESLSTEGLYEWYTTMGLPSLKGVERPAIQQLLRNYLTWENQTQAELLDQCSLRQIICPGEAIILEILAVEGLRELYSEFNLPGSESLKRQDLKSLLLRIFEWQALPLPELREECTKLQVPTAGPTLSDEEQRHLLVCKLAFRESIEYLDLHELLELYEGFPFPEGITKKALRELLKKTLAWEALRLDELRQEYNRMQGASSEAALPREEAEQGKAEQRQQLIYKLILHERMESMSLAELSSRYEGFGLPRLEGTTRSELQGFFKRFMSWRSMSLLQLWEECISQALPTDGADTLDSEDQQAELFNLLFEHDRIEAWEAKNFKAKRIDNFEMVQTVVRAYSALERLEAEQLREEYVDLGFPDEEGLDRAGHLEALKEWLIWTALPLPELKKDCKEQGLTVPPDCGPDDQPVLAHRLVINLRCKKFAKGRLAGRAEVPKALN